MTVVKFVKNKEGAFKGEVTAVFPQLKYNKEMYGNDMCTGYAHIGQHSAVSWSWVMENTEPATEKDYKDLKAELESIGYQLKIINEKAY